MVSLKTESAVTFPFLVKVPFVGYTSQVNRRAQANALRLGMPAGILVFDSIFKLII